MATLKIQKFKNLRRVGIALSRFSRTRYFEADNQRENNFLICCGLEFITAIIVLEARGAAWTRPDLNGSSRKDSYSGSSLLGIKMSGNSKVLALKYRPQTFDDLIGQDIIAETILNSIKLDKTPNAYLFTGIRG